MVTTHAIDAGRHNFWAYADDGVRVYVNGRLVIDAWQDSSAERYDGTIDLDAGEHRIVVEYYEETRPGGDPVRHGKERSGHGHADSHGDGGGAHRDCDAHDNFDRVRPRRPQRRQQSPCQPTAEPPVS